MDAQLNAFLEGISARYLVGFGVLAILSTAGIGGVKKKDGFELACDRWTHFQLNGAAGVIGAGSLEHLRRMAQGRCHGSGNRG